MNFLIVEYERHHAEMLFRLSDKDGLLSQVGRAEVAEAIKKSRRIFAPSSTEDIAEIYRILQGRAKSYRRQFLVNEKDGYIIVPVADISYISSEAGMARLYLKSRKQYNVDLSLDYIESQLDPMLFFRATRRHIVNITSIQRITKWFNRKVKIQLSEYSETEIIISKEKVSLLRQWLDR